VQQAEFIGCVTLLTMSKVYEYQGTFYRYLYSSDSIKHTQYFFRPLPGQRKKADLKINREKVLRSMHYIPGLSVHCTIEKNHIQTTIFDYLDELKRAEREQQAGITS
jgi:hypothetical protein